MGVSNGTMEILTRLTRLGGRQQPGCLAYVASRPVETVSLLWDGTVESANTIVAVLGDEHVRIYANTTRVFPPLTHPEVEVKVKTNNGWVSAEIGHYLLWSGSDWYPCDPDTYARRWEQIASLPTPETGGA